MAGLDHASMTERWRDGGHAFRFEAITHIRQMVCRDIGATRQYLPGAGSKREDLIALYSTYILEAANRMAAVTDRARTAAALRRLADMVERGQLDGARA